MFLIELCGVLDLPYPDAARALYETNDYAFERVVKEVGRDGATLARRIDLSERDC